ncbi:MAG: tRNA (adenosine(37)-N6)-dimethylallyltransferase MiaA [Chlamydiota bacterium]|nr:tRNA (adenosine(37)-N6)-dimethylallyltransferase MiaA [Chlamydiota bacterium]
MSAGTTLEQDEIERIFWGFAVQAQQKLSSQIDQPAQKVIVLSGPTAAGKSGFAIDLARKLGGEIISADSMQVYRGMDIGTAKITQEESQGIPHYLIDIRDVNDIYNVVDFYYEARQCCQSILARGKVPIFVGGTGFYIHSLMYGPPSGPPSVPELRKKLEEDIENLGSEIMYERLTELDPEYAASITKNDKQKIVRGLEIIRLTGEKVSRLSWRERQRPQNYNFHCWFLHRPREHLYQRIEKRCDEMIGQGFLDEVIKLDKMGIRENTSASQAIGYRQALEFLQTEKTDDDRKYFINKFKQASRNYAKRQFTWFRREKAFRWLDLDLHDYEVAMEMVIQDFDCR